MQAAGTLPVNVSFIFEGEHNRGSKGCIEAISQHHHWFTNCSLVVVSDGQWAGEEIPCLIYGMRGIIKMSVQISSPDQNLHSGNHGGIVCEPLSDLSKVLGSLLDEPGHVAVPGFYDGLRSGLMDRAEQVDANNHEKLETMLTDIAALRLSKLSGSQGNPKETLEALWCKPSLSIVGVNIGTCHDAVSAVNVPLKFSVIPNAATGSLCIRFVADQKPSVLVEAVKQHIESEFKKLNSKNVVSITVHEASSL